MRRVATVILCALVLLVTVQTPAYAWFDWLEEYSGPGPFWGVDVQWRVHCFNDDIPTKDVAQELNNARTSGQLSQVLPVEMIAEVDAWKQKQSDYERARTEFQLQYQFHKQDISRLPVSDDRKDDIKTFGRATASSFSAAAFPGLTRLVLAPMVNLGPLLDAPFAAPADATLNQATPVSPLISALGKLARAQNDFQVADDHLTERVKKFFGDVANGRRMSDNPGDYVLRSRQSLPGVATFFGAGCFTDTAHHARNPIGSLNIRMAYFQSLHNQLTYADRTPQDPPTVRLLQPEVSYSGFIDPRKSIEVGSGVGWVFPWVQGEQSSHGWLYWRPLILNISPVALVGAETSPFWKGFLLTSSIVITGEIKAEDFGAVKGTFDQNREIQLTFGFTYDLSRLVRTGPAN